MSWLLRLKDLLIRRILHLDDTPNRIAWGVFLGFLVAFTPTLGLQIVIYVAVATLLRANKVSGVPFLFITNPFTAVPLYYFVWKVGAFVLRFGNNGDSVTEEKIAAWLGETGRVVRNTDWERLVEWEYWADTGRVLVSTGAELWVGALVCGLVTGVPAYFVTRWAVGTFRHLRDVRRESRLPEPPDPAYEEPPDQGHDG